MAYINKNANLLLLFLVTLGFTLLVGTTVFYSNNLSKLNERYEEKVDALKQTEKDLNTKLQVIEQIRQDLKLKSEREQTFTEKYTEIRDIKEGLEDEKTRLTRENEALDNEVSAAKSSLKDAQNQLAFEEAKNEQLEQENSECLDDLRHEERINDDLRDQISSLNSQLDACQGN